MICVLASYADILLFVLGGVLTILFIHLVKTGFTTRKLEKSNGITEGIFSSVTYTDGNNSVSKSVGIYRRI
jgi:hypothetical protein